MIENHKNDKEIVHNIHNIDAIKINSCLLVTQKPSESFCTMCQRNVFFKPLTDSKLFFLECIIPL